MSRMNENITIYAPGVDYNRFQAALDVQNASNPSGVARELVKVILAAMNDSQCTGTDYVRNDPAVILVIDKLVDLTGRRDVLDPVDGYNSMFALCEELSRQKR